MIAFWNTRNTPMSVLCLEANRPLVSVGGQRQLTEQFYDTCYAADSRAGIGFAFYDTMLAGGEPYAVWR